MIEVRLGRGETAVDFSVGIPASRLADGWASLLQPPLQAIFGPGPDSRLANIESLWLEFDLHREIAGGSLPEPVLCAKLRGEPDVEWLLGDLLPALHGKTLRPAQERLARRALAALPPGARVLYVFSLRTRGVDDVRFELIGLPSSAMAGYMAEVEPSLVPEIEGLVPWIEGCHRPHLSFDVGDEIRPRLGLEGSFERQPNRDPRWRRRFDEFVARGWCTEEKRDTVLAWTGWDSARSASGGWPPWREESGVYCARAVSHFKVIGEEGRTKVKAYLIYRSVKKRSIQGSSERSEAKDFSTDHKAVISGHHGEPATKTEKSTSAPERTHTLHRVKEL